MTVTSHNIAQSQRPPDRLIGISAAGIHGGEPVHGRPVRRLISAAAGRCCRVAVI
jgi:hypothetical protein